MRVPPWTRVAVSMVAVGVVGHFRAEGEVSASSTASGVMAPPPAPPVLERVAEGRRALGLSAEAHYSIGEPTDEEQLAVEYINRARANPVAEAERLATTSDVEVRAALEFYKVDLDLMRAQFAELPVVPPLSLHPALTAAARRHSTDMFQNAFQGHTGSDGTTVGQRVEQAGYDWRMVGENVFSHAHHVWHGHAGFNVDWGPGPGNMQTPAGHRLNIHNASFREIGIGIVNGNNGPVGPQLVSHALATRSGLTPFVTGVAYHDLNGNGFYDLGEGLGGVTVVVRGAAQQASTSRSGGYSVPVPGDGAFEVRFQMAGRADQVTNVVVVNGGNVKVDFVPPYTPPTLGGTPVAYVGHDNRFPFTAVAGATEYDGRVQRRVPWTTVEGAESGLGRFEARVTPGYASVVNDIRQSGAGAFHLAHPNPPGDQHLVLRSLLRLGSAPVLRFASRLGTAAADQVARVQVSTDGGATWVDVWSQAGSGFPGELAFSAQRVPLPAHAGQIVNLRFAYTFSSGRFFPQTDPGVGWYFDDVLVEGAEELTEASVIGTGSLTHLTFRPATVGAYLLEVRPRLGDRVYGWGPALAVTAQEGRPEPVSLRIESLAPLAGGDWELRFRVESGEAPAAAVEEARSAAGPWTPVTATPTGSGGAFRVTIPASGEGARFFRVRD